MFKYTVCFVKKGDGILMLNRAKAPIMGIWNGVGGKIERDETPRDGAIREVLEETGIEVGEPESEGIITWSSDSGEEDGLYVFLFEIETNQSFITPIATREGILDWKDISWILDKDNMGIPAMVPYYLPYMLKDKGKFKQHYNIKNGKIIECKIETRGLAPGALTH
ncbi:NUDIX hydrolase [Bacillus sp. T33-2]|uniref:NUDIX hydrolase n=1 Tax=Bacillus sp. T33-2 TaxID=2054168 RepID=UPI000C78EDFA|nr:8-oxo-dGTP diphosphatase [Bacillus sp. T33-2]PLR92846.1 DNA mismatch repair protein MutT [Bacillus sp. T33-2]